MLELVSSDDIKIGRGHSEYIKFNHSRNNHGDWLDTLRDTKERRKSQTCKVYEIKIDKSHLNNDTLDQLKVLSLEAKWYCNNIRSKIQYGKNQESLFDLDYKIDKVSVKIGYRYEIRKLKYLSSQMKQELLDRIKDDVIRLSKKKNKGYKVGKLKFKSDVRSVPLKQYGNTYKILDSKYVKIQGIKQRIRVRGLNQIIDEKENIEAANADFINKHGDFYLHIVTYRDTKKDEKIKEFKSIGIDFGIAKQLTLSNGIKIEYNIPITKRLRRLYKKLSRQEFHSHNWEKTRIKIQKEFDNLNCKKFDIKNKIIHRLRDQYEIVCYQNDNIKSWQRIWGRRILETSIGRIKSDIEKKISAHIEVPTNFPSTKICSKCGHKRYICLDERTYICTDPKCQIKIDRDWNSSINIEDEGLRIRNIRVGTERTHFKPVETESSTLDIEYFNDIPYIKASLVAEAGSFTLVGERSEPTSGEQCELTALA